jgi:ribonuclease Y
MYPTFLLYAAGALVVGALLGFFISRAVGSKRMKDAGELAKRIIEEARKEAQAQKKGNSSPGQR